MRINHSHGGRQLGGRLMVVGNHHVHAQCCCLSNLFHCRHAGIHGDNQLHTVLLGPINRLAVQSISFLAQRNTIQHVYTSLLQISIQQNRCGYAIGIVIAIDQYALMLVNSALNALSRSFHIGIRIRINLLLLPNQKGKHSIRRINTASRQHQRQIRVDFARRRQFSRQIHIRLLLVPSTNLHENTSPYKLPIIVSLFISIFNK